MTKIDVLVVMDGWSSQHKTGDFTCRVDAREIAEARTAVAEMIAKLEQIERLSREANPDLVPGICNEIARKALARIGGAA